MKATSLLTKQHREVKAIFKTLEKGHAKSAALLKELADSLAAHMAIEQDIFNDVLSPPPNANYPARLQAIQGSVFLVDTAHSFF